MNENLNVVLFQIFKYCSSLLSCTRFYPRRGGSRLKGFVDLLSSQGKCWDVLKQNILPDDWLIFCFFFYFFFFLFFLYFFVLFLFFFYFFFFFVFFLLFFFFYFFFFCISGTVLVFSTISFNLRRSWTCSAHFISFIFLRSFLTSSSHRDFGLPTGLFVDGFHLYIFLYNTGFRHSIYVSKLTQSLGFNIICYVPMIY